MVGVQGRDPDPSFGGGIRSQGKSLCRGICIILKVEKDLVLQREDHLSIGPIQLVRLGL